MKQQLPATLVLIRWLSAGMVVYACGFCQAALNWETSKVAAVTKAAQENKLVLMLLGTAVCPYTIQAKSVLCEKTSPDIHGLLEQNYVPWFADMNYTGEGKEYFEPYTIYLYPVFACIDPADSSACLDLSSGAQEPQSFYTRLLSHINEPLEEMQFTLVWHKAGRDKLTVLLPFVTDTQPFTDQTKVSCQLGRLEKTVMPEQPAKVKKTMLKVKDGATKLKMMWDPATKRGYILFKMRKAALAESIELVQTDTHAVKVVRFCITLDGTTYRFYPKVSYHKERKGKNYVTVGAFQR